MRPGSVALTAQLTAYSATQWTAEAALNIILNHPRSPLKLPQLKFKLF